MAVDIIGSFYTIILVISGIIGIIEFISAGLVGAKAGVTLVCLIFGPIAGYGAITSNFYVLISIAILVGGLMGYYFFKSEHFMLPGLIVFLSLIMVMQCIIYFANKQNQHSTI